ARRRSRGSRHLPHCRCRRRISGCWPRRSPRTPSSSSRSFRPSCRRATRRSGSTPAGVTDLSEHTIRKASDLLDAGSLSSHELVEATLARIDETEPLVHAYVTVMAESARAEARRADEERPSVIRRSPLQGIPVAVKDVLWTRDTPTGAGSRVLAGFVPHEDATAVRRIREAGAVIIGKHVTHEFACGQDVPPTRSAWHSAHYPGGSSAGLGVSAAVGSSLAATGTD